MKGIGDSLRSMHENPVKRGLVPSPELWRWSSFRAYIYGEANVVKIAAPDGIREKKPTIEVLASIPPHPRANPAREWGTHSVEDHNGKGWPTPPSKLWTKGGELQMD